MTRKRRTFGAAFKAKVALAAAKADRTTAQLASEYGVHAGQVTAWKRSSWYHVPQGESAENLAMMRAIDELYTRAAVQRIADGLQEAVHQPKAGPAADETAGARGGVPQAIDESALSRAQGFPLFAAESGDFQA